IPKFRAWDIFHNKWVKHFYITENGLIYNMEQLHRDLIGAVPIEQSGLIVMQSTGLFDVNGKEIFEGDVVRVTCEHPIDFPDCKGVVRMLEGRYMVCDDKTERCSELFSEIFSNEIIGNIYENPELMEVLDEN
uniref:YopX family protein n=1 Tax=Streptococcus suis TaxID=1307 RepID=UPI002ED07410